MTRILAEYRANPEFYDEDAGFFYGNFVYELDKLKAFVEYDKENDQNGSFTYSGDEAARIVRKVENGQTWDLEEHDKYTFFDTSGERAMVLASDQDPSTVDYVVRIYLNS